MDVPQTETAAPKTSAPDKTIAWERRTLEKLLMETLVEQRRRRRWGIFFKLLLAAYVGIFLLLTVDWGGQNHDETESVIGKGKHTAVVNLRGVIADREDASAANVIKGLRAAFADKDTAAVVLRINSPGGSPVQAGEINNEIRRLRQKYANTPLYAVVEDICASGGYYAAVAADKIFVDKASIVGSIGVLIDGFGFVGTLDKFGVERRLLTAGENKGFLDPFSPQNAAHKAHAQNMLGEIHAQFIAAVKAGRGTRLRETPDMFSGLMWTGERSIKMGLADAEGSVGSVARDIAKAETLHDFSVSGDLFERVSRRFGSAAAFWDKSLPNGPQLR